MQAMLTIRRQLYLLIILSFMLSLMGCNNRPAPEGELKGRILLWHGWPKRETAALSELLDQFRAIHPEVLIIETAVPAEALRSQFEQRAALGLEPDILIGPSDWVRPLSEAGLIRDLTNQPGLETYLYRAPALETLRYQGKLYGLPLALDTTALYYNTSLVTEPAETLDEWLNQARDGLPIALNTQFEAAFWGIQAFGGQLWDDSQQQVVLNQGGFANWLGWLKIAQDEPNIFLDSDDTVLYDLFKRGEVAYYVGSSAALPALQAALGQNKVGVAPLPSGPNGPSGPFLRTEAMFFNNVSSDEQFQLTLQLAQFLSRTEQQRELARRIGKLPVNPQVRLDERVYPALAGFLAQTRTAIPRPNLPAMDKIAILGNDAYIQALAGVVAVQEVANRVTQELNGTAADKQTAAPTACPTTLRGGIRIAHSWHGAAATTLNEIRQTFGRLCPEIFISLSAYDTPAQLLAQYQTQAAKGGGADLIIGSASWIKPLQTGSDKPLLKALDAKLLQPYVPVGQNAVRYQNGVYGLPVSLNLLGLYYRGDQVTEPPHDLADLLSQTNVKHSLAMPLDFYYGFWGLQAFGGLTFNKTNYHPTLNPTPFAAWLTWLEEAQNRPGIILNADPAVMQARFVAGEATYFVGEATALSDLEAALGQNLRVAPLPTGSNANTAPIVKVEALMVNGRAKQNRIELATEFAKYFTSSDNQLKLMRQANLVPANVNVNLKDNRQFVLGTFFEMAKTPVALPYNEEVAQVFKLGDPLYEEVLDRKPEVMEIVTDYIKLLEETLKFAVTSAPAPRVAEVCNQTAQVTLWHDWSGQAETTLNELLTEFKQICPNVEVTPRYITTDKLLAELTTTQTMPDLFLAPHELLGSLQQRKLIQAITSFVDLARSRVRYLPQTVEALQQGQQLYGLPQTIELPTLYYRPEARLTPPKLLTDLVTRSIAMPADFYSSSWGVTAFGQPFTVTNGVAKVNSTAWVNWLAWSQANQTISMSLQATRLFTTQQISYVVASSNLLPSLQRDLAPQKVALAPLPSGVTTPTRPLMRVTGWFFPAANTPQQTQIALKLAQFMTNESSQSRLMNEANVIPTNITVSPSQTSPMSSLVAQAKQGVIWPTNITPEVVVLGNIMYQQIWQRKLTPTIALKNWLEASTLGHK